MVALSSLFGCFDEELAETLDAKFGHIWTALLETIAKMLKIGWFTIFRTNQRTFVAQCLPVVAVMIVYWFNVIISCYSKYFLSMPYFLLLFLIFSSFKICIYSSDTESFNNGTLDILVCDNWGTIINLFLKLESEFCLSASLGAEGISNYSF